VVAARLNSNTVQEDRVNLPQLPLGVAVMDDDHYALEQMFSRTPQSEDAALPAHLDAIIEAIRAHFAREEAEMERVGVPILHCHQGQHAALLKEAEILREGFLRAESRMRRHLIGFTLAPACRQPHRQRRSDFLDFFQPEDR
jgi:hemerythrin-like metal-binding protein